MEQDLKDLVNELKIKHGLHGVDDFLEACHTKGLRVIEWGLPYDQLGPEICPYVVKNESVTIDSYHDDVYLYLRVKVIAR